MSPAGSPRSVNITVTTSGGTTATSAKDLFAYGPPTITSFTPTSGITGGTVTITGTAYASGMSVYFGSLKSAKVTLISGTTLKATVPNGATPGAITVPDGQGSATSTAAFTPTFSITSFTPTSGPPGTVVTIGGVGFLSTSVVKFNGLA